MSPAEFLDLCRYHLSEGELAQLEAITLIPGSDTAGGGYVHERWQAYETALRNLCVHIRAQKSRREPGDYLREDRDVFGGLESHVQDAFNRTPLQMEEHLDHLRWQFLDSLLVGREFSFDILAAYRLKLLILEKRSGIDKEQGTAKLKDFLSEKLTSDQLPEFIHE